MKDLVLRGMMGVFIPFCLTGAGLAAPTSAELLRPPPMRTLATTRTLLATDFGIQPGGKDVFPEVKALLERLMRENIPTTLVFPPGKYRMVPTGDSRYCMTLHQVRDHVIDGTGAEVSVGNLGGFFSAKQCTNLILKGFKVDWDPLPFTQTRVRTVEKDRILVEIEPGFPTPADTPDFAVIFEKGKAQIVLKDPVFPKRLKPGVPNWFRMKAATHDGERRWWVPVSDTGAFAPGDPVVFTCRNIAKGSFVGLSWSHRVSLIGLENFAAPGVNYGVGHSGLLDVLDCRVTIKEGRWFSGNADGFHFKSLYPGPWIESCVIEGMGDDGMTLCQIPAVAVASEGNRLDLHTPDGSGYGVGDEIQIYNNTRDLDLGAARVVAVLRDSFYQKSLALDRPIALAAPGTSYAERKNYSQVKDDVDMAYNLKYGQGFVIRNSVFRNIRRFGITIQAQRGLIEHCVFSNLSMSGICLRNDGTWPEGFVPRDITVRHCRFEQNGFDAPTWYGDLVALSQAKERPSSNRMVQDLSFENNLFLSHYTRAFYLSGLSHVRLVSNTVRNFRKEGDVLHAQFATGIEIRNLDAEGARTPTIRLGQGCVPDDVILSPRKSPLTFTRAFDPSTEFSELQGKNGWRYLEQRGARSDEMTYDPKTRQWNGSGKFCMVSHWAMHPARDSDAIRSWTSPVAGLAVMKGWPHAPGSEDGVIAVIRKNGETLWTRTILASERPEHRVECRVKAGDVIDFVVRCHGNEVNDLTWWLMGIEVMEGPSSGSEN